MTFLFWLGADLRRLDIYGYTLGNTDFILSAVAVAGASEATVFQRFLVVLFCLLANSCVRNHTPFEMHGVFVTVA